ncbi:MAG: Diaminopimelate epimerase [Streptosporangiaceae bacterium]|nr:Diaminopimelate epimerase [Streptosporangiaceae bacterium]
MTRSNSPLRILLAHGSGNEIFLVEGDPRRLFDGPEQATAFVRALNDRSGPLGGDGIYFFEDGEVPEAHFFNPDGTPAALCGNGLRVLGRLLLERHDRAELTVRIGENLFRIRSAPSPAPGVTSVAIDLPVVSTEAARVPIVTPGRTFVERVIPGLDSELRFTAIAVPNPHIVAIVDDYDEDRLVDIGGRVERERGAGVLPAGANVSFLQPLPGGEVFVRTFERGAGLTPSCGSGVVASRSVYSVLTDVPPEARVTVRNIGGVAASSIRVEGDAWLPLLEGNATNVLQADLLPADLVAGRAEIDRVEFTDETVAFDRLNQHNLTTLAAAGVKVR